MSTDTDPAPPARSTKQDWVLAGLRILITEGIDQVKILRLAQDLGVARSSFYWFFSDRQTLLDTLLAEWSRKNTGAITNRANAKTATITEAVYRVFECWTDDRLFDARLDFAIREWARRDPGVRQSIDAADNERISALSGMFRRHGFDRQPAFVRARILYFTQIGYYALVKDESIRARQSLVDDYVIGFTGQTPLPGEHADFQKFLEDLPNPVPAGGSIENTD